MLKVVYEDNYILVADKPSGMAVHPSKLHQGDTLADAVREHLGVSEDEFTFRCITRLDKDTSGLVLIAKTLEAAQKLNEDMAARRIQREYEATVEDGIRKQDITEVESSVTGMEEAKEKEPGDKGEKEKAEDWNKNHCDYIPDKGTVDAPIARMSDDEHDIRRCVDFERGERAVTHYEVTERGEGYAKIRCRLETGRTHQIRVHMQYLGHPVTGDRLYNPVSAERMNSQAMCLRAVRLTFPHPLTGDIMQVV